MAKSRTKSRGAARPSKRRQSTPAKRTRAASQRATPKGVIARKTRKASKARTAPKTKLARKAAAARKARKARTTRQARTTKTVKKARMALKTKPARQTQRAKTVPQQVAAEKPDLAVKPTRSVKREVVQVTSGDHAEAAVSTTPLTIEPVAQQVESRPRYTRRSRQKPTSLERPRRILPEAQLEQSPEPTLLGTAGPSRATWNRPPAMTIQPTAVDAAMTDLSPTGDLLDRLRLDDEEDDAT